VSGEPTALTLDEAVALGYAMVVRAAEDVGVRALAIKGPVLALQGLREPKASVDVDVLVDPAGLARVLSALAGLGWHDDGLTETPGIVPQHSVTVRHPRWPCEVDVHHWFPGFLADPAEVFDVLWARRTTVPIAHTPVTSCDPVGSAAIAALHYLRDQHKQAPLDELAGTVRGTWTATQVEELATLAADTGAADTLRPFLDQVGAPAVASTRPLVVPLVDWHTRSQTGTTEVLPWLVELGRTPLARRPGLVWRAVWLRDEQFRGWDPSLPQTRGALARARWARVQRGWRALPGAAREYRRLRKRP
jgi:hypothetical protein